MNWSSLDFITIQMDFGDKWRRWIRFCISSVRYSILVNDNPCGFFGSSRGLRQGVPLSPSLFILVMEALSRMMDKAVMGGYLKGFNAMIVGVGTVLVSHLLFADDTLVCCDADMNQLDHLGQVLNWFQALKLT